MAVIISSQSPSIHARSRVISHVSSVGETITTAGTVLPESIGDVITIYDDYTASSSNYTILADCSAVPTAIIITLPKTVNVDELELHFKKIDGEALNVTITADTSDINGIDGSPTQVLTNQEDVLNIIADADGLEWQILGDLP